MKKLLTKNSNDLTKIVSDRTITSIPVSEVPSLLTNDIERNITDNNNETSNHPFNNEKNSNNILATYDANDPKEHHNLIENSNNDDYDENNQLGNRDNCDN